MGDRRKIGIAVIHGIGAQARPLDGDPTFSAALYRGVLGAVGAGAMAEVAWQEIHWADIFQEKENAYLERMYDGSGGAREILPFARRFVLYSLADASGYLYTAMGGGADTLTAYRRVRNAVRDALAALEARVEEEAPLLVLAHSMGGQIVTDYLYDVNKDGADGGRPSRNHIPVSDFQRGRSLRAFVTFGCNIPIFVMALDDHEIVEVRNPGLPWRADAPWWFNYYDRSDVLGYPLKEISSAYRGMVRDGKLVDVRVNAGGWLSPTPFSHNGYWSHRTIAAQVGEIVETLLAG